jgi:hypothetical protein
VVGANALVGLWALGAHGLAPLRANALWWCTGVAYVAVFVQVALGVALVAIEDIEAPEFHMFYGFLCIIAVAIVYSYRNQLEAYRYLLFGGGSLFIMGLAIRAMFLG